MSARRFILGIISLCIAVLPNLVFGSVAGVAAHAARARHGPDQLVERIVAADIFADGEERTGCIGKGRGMNGARLRIERLIIGEHGEGSEYGRGRNLRCGVDPRVIAGGGLQFGDAAKAAAGLARQSART